MNGQRIHFNAPILLHFIDNLPRCYHHPPIWYQNIVVTFSPACKIKLITHLKL